MVWKWNEKRRLDVLMGWVGTGGMGWDGIGMVLMVRIVWDGVESRVLVGW